MITDEEIKRIACQTEISYVVTNGDMTAEELACFARAIYHLGRQHQRESDAALCDDFQKKSYLSIAGSLAKSIRNNTGELK